MQEGKMNNPSIPQTMRRFLQLKLTKVSSHSKIVNPMPMFKVTLLCFMSKTF